MKPIQKLFCLTLLLVGSLMIKTVMAVDLGAADKRVIAYQLVSSAENSSLDWQAHYDYIEDIEDGRGYTGGIIGFTSGNGDMMDVIKAYSQIAPQNPLKKFIPALQEVNGSDSHDGLGESFEAAWHEAAKTAEFRTAQDQIRDRDYFTPSVKLAQQDGLSILGQFIYYDAAVVHGYSGDENESETLVGIRKAALQKTKSPKNGGDETAFLKAFLDARDIVMASEAAHKDLSRTATQRKFLSERNFDLALPLQWTMYGDSYSLKP